MTNPISPLTAAAATAPGSAVNRSINSSTAEQGGVGGVHDGIDCQLRDVCLHCLQQRFHLAVLPGMCQ